MCSGFASDKTVDARLTRLRFLELQCHRTNLAVTLKHGTLNAERIDAAVALRSERHVDLGIARHLAQELRPAVGHEFHRRSKTSPRLGIMVVVVERLDDGLELFRMPRSSILAPRWNRRLGGRKRAGAEHRFGNVCLVGKPTAFGNRVSEAQLLVALCARFVLPEIRLGLRAKE